MWETGLNRLRNTAGGWGRLLLLGVATWWCSDTSQKRLSLLGSKKKKKKRLDPYREGFTNSRGPPEREEPAPCASGFQNRHGGSNICVKNVLGLLPEKMHETFPCGLLHGRDTNLCNVVATWLSSDYSDGLHYEPPSLLGASALFIPLAWTGFPWIGLIDPASTQSKFSFQLSYASWR